MYEIGNPVFSFSYYLADDSDSEKDGEDDAWEKQQIRKGVTGTQVNIESNYL